jgi:hypothetical protein
MYFDEVAGRWAAFARCVRCGTLRGLAIGDPVHGAVFPNQPLATALISQGVRRSLPPSWLLPQVVPIAPRAWARLPLADGAIVIVAVADVRAGAFGTRRERVYVALLPGDRRPPSVSTSFREAVEAALAGCCDAAWLARAERQLAGELVS